MDKNEAITLTRDVEAIAIPDGHCNTLAKDTVVTIHQTLGNNYTIVTDYGNMFRIAGVDADALGKQIHSPQTLVGETDQESVAKNCWEKMKAIYDPEIPVNIVALGLVYHCHVTAVGADLNDVHVIMTLTAPGCGMGPVIQSDVEKSIKAVPGVNSINVEVVLDPPWSQDMMSEVAKIELGLL